jgi:hypothetical protein
MEKDPLSRACLQHLEPHFSHSIFGDYDGNFWDPRLVPIAIHDFLDSGWTSGYIRCWEEE